MARIHPEPDTWFFQTLHVIRGGEAEYETMGTAERRRHQRRQPDAAIFDTG